MKKIIYTLSASMLVMLLFAGLASAHVVVYPKQVTQGTYEKFTVRVPTEKDTNTIKIEVLIPAGVDISKFEPKDGWSYTTTKDDTGKITSVTWTATGEGLPVTAFGEFNMQGKIADDATSLVWKAHQTYQDGTVVDWTGTSDDATPASVTTVVPVSAQSAADKPHAASKWPLYLAIAALVVSLAALVTAFKKKA